MSNTVSLLKSLQTTANAPRIDKILCILEGKLELNIIFRIFNLLGFSNCCDDLASKKIKVAWGKENQIVSNCNFNGGHQTGALTPLPAKEAYNVYKNKVNSYKGILTIFDSDVDINSNIENFFINEYQTINIEKYLLVSNPCFEKTLIDFCSCGQCLTIALALPENPTSKCQKYKTNFPQLPCFKSFTNTNYKKRQVNPDILVEKLDINNLSGLSEISKITELKDFIIKLN